MARWPPTKKNASVPPGLPAQIAFNPYSMPLPTAGKFSAEADKASKPEIDPASPLLFVINDKSGRNNPAETRQAIEDALRDANRRGEFFSARPSELAEVARKTAARALSMRTVMVAVGGDGTINSVAQAAYAQGCAMGLVPQGTFNYFARTHRIPTDPAEATTALLRSRPVPVQVGLINDMVFLVNASVGLYPELLEDREAYKKRFGRSRIVALASTLATLMTEHRQLRLRIESGAEARDVSTPTLFVGNNRLQLEQVGLPDAHALDHGWMAAVMLRPIGTLSMLGLLFRGAMGTLGEADTVESFEFHRLIVRQRHALRTAVVKVAFDGEVNWMRGPLDFRVAPKPLHLVKPGDQNHDPGSTSASI